MWYFALLTQRPRHTPFFSSRPLEVPLSRRGLGDASWDALSPDRADQAFCLFQAGGLSTQSFACPAAVQSQLGDTSSVLIPQRLPTLRKAGSFLGLAETPRA